MSSNVRAEVAELLAPLIADSGWAVKPHTVKRLTTLAEPTLYIEHVGIEQAEVAPVGTVTNTVVVTIVDHHTDYEKAEDALDPGVLELITALDAHTRLAWSRADKTEIADTYLAWALRLTVITEKETEEE